MQLLEPQIINWINNYPNSEKTQEAARTSYMAIRRYLDETNQDMTEWLEIMKKPDKSKYYELSKMVKHLTVLSEKKVEPASIKQYYNFWKGYLAFVHDIMIYKEEAKHIVKLPKNIRRLRSPLTHDMIKKLCLAADDIQRAEYIVLSSSGMRMTEFLRTPKENFDLDNGTVKIAGKVTKTATERMTFISSEAIENIERVGDSFWQERKYHDEATYFWRLRRKVGLTATYDNPKMHRVNLHAFRSFTRTQAGKINTDFAEKLIGHGYLKQYVRIEDEPMLKYYKKLEPMLRIF